MNADYMRGMMAGQRWAVAAVYAAIRGEPYDVEGATPELRQLLADIADARPVLKKSLWIVGILCGLEPFGKWNAAALIQAMDAWLARSRRAP